MRFGIMSLAALATAIAFAPTAFADGHLGEGDPEKGEKVWKKCKACHKIGEGAKNGVGPLLNEVIGRTAGTLENYKYGKDMIAAGEAGLVWDAALIAAYIEDPKKFLKEYLDNSKAKSKMTLKVKKEKDRLNVSAYVATFSTRLAPEEAEEEAPSE